MSTATIAAALRPLGVAAHISPDAVLTFRDVPAFYEVAELAGPTAVADPELVTLAVVDVDGFVARMAV